MNEERIAIGSASQIANKPEKVGQIRPTAEPNDQSGSQPANRTTE